MAIIAGPGSTATDLPDHPLRQLLGDDAFRALLEQEARNRAIQAQGNRAVADASGAAQAGGSQHPLAPSPMPTPVGSMPTQPWSGAGPASPVRPFQDQSGFVGSVDNGGEWRGERPGFPTLVPSVPSSGGGMEMPAGVSGGRDMQAVAATIRDATPGFDWRDAIQKVGFALSQINPATAPAGLAIFQQMQGQRGAQRTGQQLARIQQQADTDPAMALQQIDARLQNPQGLTEEGVRGLLTLRQQYGQLIQRRRVMERLGLTSGNPAAGAGVETPQLAGPGVGMQTAPAPAGAPSGTVAPGAMFQDPARLGFIMAANGLMDLKEVAPLVNALKGKFSMHDTAAGTIILDEQTGNRVQLSGVKPIVTNEGQSLVTPDGRVLFTAPKTHMASEGSSVVVTQPNAAGEMEAQTLLTAPKTVKDEPGSTMGKLVEDAQRAERIYGKGSPQHRALLDAVQAERSGGASGVARLGEVRGVRQEFTKLSGDFIAVRDAHVRVTASAKNPSAAGDLALIFNYMKILDPGSVVRESEFAQAAATGSFGERLKAAAQRLLRGERLSDEMRADFVNRAGELYGAQLGSQRRLERNFRDLATRSGMKPEDVVIPFAGDDGTPAPKPGPATASPSTGPPPPAGAQGTATINGRTIRGTVR